jgi:hypothetical protein
MLSIVRLMLSIVRLMLSIVRLMLSIVRLMLSIVRLSNTQINGTAVYRTQYADRTLSRDQRANRSDQLEAFCPPQIYFKKIF